MGRGGRKRMKRKKNSVKTSRRRNGGVWSMERRRKNKTKRGGT